MPKSEDKDRESFIPLTINGKTIPWKLILVILGLLGVGGGGISQYNLATEDEVKEIIDSNSEKIQGQIETNEKRDDARHIQIDDTFRKVIGTVEEIQTVQHKQFSREEARRLTEKIKDRDERDRIQYRLVDMNLNRLKSGREPCANIDCTN